MMDTMLDTMVMITSISSMIDTRVGDLLNRLLCPMRDTRIRPPGMAFTRKGDTQCRTLDMNIMNNNNYSSNRYIGTQVDPSLALFRNDPPHEHKKKHIIKTMQIDIDTGDGSPGGGRTAGVNVRLMQS